MTTLFKPDGSPVEVDETDVPAAFASGKLGLPAGTKVPLRLEDGTIEEHPVEGLTDAFAKGASVVSAADLEQHRAEQAEGGLGGELETAALSGLKGATVGLSDVAGAALGGEKYKALRRREELANPTISGASELAGSVAPLLASDGASAAVEGGEAAAEGGGVVSRLLRGIGAPARGVNAAGEAAERGATAVARDLAGQESLTGAAGLAQRLAPIAARGATEGAIYSGGDELARQAIEAPDETSMGDGNVEANGQKLLAALGHGALLGGAGGLLLGGTGEIGREILGRATPGLRTLADESTVRAFNINKKAHAAIDAKFGGMKPLADRARIEGLVSLGDNIEDIAKKTAARVEDASAELKNVVGEVGVEGVPLSDVIGTLDRQIASYAKDANGAAAEAKVRALRDRFERIYADKVAAAEREAGAGLTDEGTEGEAETARLAAYRAFKRNPPMETAEDVLNGGRSPAKLEEMAQAEGERAAAEARGKFASPEARAAVTVPFDELLRQRRGIEKDLDWLTDKAGSRAMKHAGRGLEDLLIDAGDRIADGKGAATAMPTRKPIGIERNEAETARLAAYRAFKRNPPMETAEDVLNGGRSPAKLEEMAQAEGERAAAEARGKFASPIADGKGAATAGELAPAQRAGAAWREKYLAAKKRMHELLFLNDAADNAMAQRGANRGGTLGLSATDSLAAAGGLAGGMASHGILGGLTGVATGAVHHILRERLNSTAAVVADRVAALAGIKRAVAHVDEQIERGVQNAVDPGARAKPKVKEPIYETKDRNVRYGKRSAAVANAVALPDAHAEAVNDAVSSLEPHAPGTANAFKRAALMATAFLASKIPHTAPHNPLDPTAAPKWSDSQRAEFDRTVDMVHDPVGQIFHALDSGTLTKSQVATLAATHPQIHQQIVNGIKHELSTATKPIPFQRRQSLATLLGQPVIQPSLQHTLQSAVGGGNSAEENNALRAQAPKRMIKGIANSAALPGEHGGAG